MADPGPHATGLGFDSLAAIWVQKKKKKKTHAKLRGGFTTPPCFLFTIPARQTVPFGCKMPAF